MDGLCSDVPVEGQVRKEREEEELFRALSQLFLLSLTPSILLWSFGS